MCGITGIYAFSDKGKEAFALMSPAVQCLRQRGPDGEGTYTDGPVTLGHTRLAVIDTSSAGAQPMSDTSGRYTIVFNGEFFNYRQHRQALLEKGIPFRTHTDTEVLLHLYITEGVRCLDHINGFFAFAVYDKLEQSLFIARDRMGVKPLYIFQDADRLMFASELKSLMALGIPKELDTASLFIYLQLNYIPAPFSIFRNVQKLLPGHYMTVRGSEVRSSRYYSIPFDDSRPSEESYESLQKRCFTLMEKAVERRMVSDVPLGSFLSGGIDSSVITALASQRTSHLKTFSIGFKNAPRFDETYYAALVAKQYRTDHTVFSLSNEDLYEHLHAVLDYTDEPFADSSALPVFILSRYTRRHVTVALSGDGADEAFGGYNKHRAEQLMRSSVLRKTLLKYASPLLDYMPRSRESRISNTLRQLSRFAEGARLSAAERYWRWCAFRDEEDARRLLSKPFSQHEYEERKTVWLSPVTGRRSLNEVLYADMQLVLPNDMLTKVDLMSMANSLEIRNPFLDYELVDFAFTVPSAYKVSSRGQKTILRDTFRSLLPAELYNRPKQGFEVPLLGWFRSELKALILEDLLDDTFIRSQGIFSVLEVQKLKKRLFSANPGDVHAQVWGLIVFQHWWKKWMT
jgi:asparagine synthase (glutamine-hydrolysing)